MRVKTLLLAFLLAAGLPASALSQSRPVSIVLPVPSTWVSQSSGTLVVLHVANDGVIQGAFSSTACGPMATRVIGKVVSQTITFATTLASCNRIMAWRGKVSEKAIATGVTTISVRADGTVLSTGPNGDLFARTR